jgi:hypothetical protein
VTLKGTIVTERGRYSADEVTISLTEAKRHGYPKAEGCHILRDVLPRTAATR